MMDAQAIEVSASIPCPRDLRCMVGRVNPIGTGNPWVKSRYHGPIFTCRLVIHSLPEVIASPTIDVDGGIHIVTTEDMFKTGKVQSVLGDLNIQCLRFTEVEQKVYEACLNYTLSFNVAPAWNKVADHLLQGRDFLTSSIQLIKAVKLNAVVTDEVTRFLISPTTVRLPRLTLEHFSLSPRAIENFMRDETGLIELNDPKTRAWVYVLPSLKKGRVMSISKRIPESSPFENYRKLKRHWKNMYGYRLPETETGLIYYQVYFPWIGRTCYTYPNHCLSSAKLVKFRLDDARNTAVQFLKDLTEKMPKICDATLKLKELRSSANPHHFQADNRKENIPNNRSSVGKRYGEIWNLQATPCNARYESTAGLTSSEHYINRFTTSCDDYEQKSSSKSLNEGDRNTETICSPRPAKSQIDKSAKRSLKDEKEIGNREESFSLVRNRSSFEFHEFSKALSGEDLFCKAVGEYLTGRPKRSGIGNDESDSPPDGTAEKKSRFFDDPRNESHGYVSLNSPSDYLEVKIGSNESKSPSGRLKLHRLSNKRLRSSGKPTIDPRGRERLALTKFQTRDISSYFGHKKKMNGHEELGVERRSTIGIPGKEEERVLPNE